MVDRIHGELTFEEINKGADRCRAWRFKGWAGRPLPAAVPNSNELRARSDAPYQDEEGFRKSVKLEEILTHGYVLTPGCYVGAAEAEEDVTRLRKR